MSLRGAKRRSNPAAKNKGMKKQYFVYIATNNRHTVLYTGMRNNILRRAWEHKSKTSSGFTARYNVSKIVYFERFGSPEEAIIAEKKIKGGSRRRKIDLINSMNPDWRDLSEGVVL